jgi:hypothetical protein
MLKEYKFEGTLVGIIAGVIIALTVVSHLTARTDPKDRLALQNASMFDSGASHPRLDRLPAGSAQPQLADRLRMGSMADKRAPRPLKPSDPLEVVVVPNPISGKFRLLTASRMSATPTTDELRLRLRVVSLATADLVTPFQSGMFEVRPEGAEPINPAHAFSHPVPAGGSQEEDIVFIVPSTLNLDHAALRIHYYNDQKEILLGKRVTVHHLS